MSEDRGWIIVVAVGVGIWLAFFGGWTTVKGWLGQDNYEHKRAALASHMQGNRIGTSADVWLVKANFGVPDRVALFFGYLDDWDARYEFLTSHSDRFPADVYRCEFAN
jgi:hypothetical protein